MSILTMDRMRRMLAACGASARAGLMATDIAGVRLFWSDRSGPVVPLAYDRGIVLVFQGGKTGYLGARRFDYDPENYLVLSRPLPFACATVATPDRPLCGVFVDANAEDLAFLVTELERSGSRRDVQMGAGSLSTVCPVPMSSEMTEASDELIRALCDPVLARATGDARRRAVILAALRGPMGPALCAILGRQVADDRIDRAIERMRRDLALPHATAELADLCAMSVTSFHRAFRARTGQTPLQYLKRLRLHTARRLIVFEKRPIAEAARRVGYESASQFSREYRRLFDESPATSRVRAAEDALPYADPLVIDLELRAAY